MRDTERDRGRDKAKGEAGSLQGAGCGTRYQDPRTPGSRSNPRADAQPLSHPGAQQIYFLWAFWKVLFGNILQCLLRCLGQALGWKCKHGHDRGAPTCPQGVHNLPGWGVGGAARQGEEEAESKLENKTQRHTLIQHTLSRTEAH